MDATVRNETIRLTSLSHGGGCGCKIAPAALTEILAKLPSGLLDPALLVGTETSDDAAVYKLNDEQAIVATTDFFMPIVDDPHDFGRIAATNALSDIYAMGARPLLALAIVGMPLGKLTVEVIQQILAGGATVCRPRAFPSLAVTRSIRSSRSTVWWCSGWCIRNASSATARRTPATCWCLARPWAWAS